MLTLDAYFQAREEPTMAVAQSDVSPSADDVLDDTRRQWCGVAEILPLGTPCRCGRAIGLSVGSDGFGGAMLPSAAKGAELEWPHGKADLAGSDRLIARPCAIPANDVAVARIVPLRKAMYGITPILRKPSVEIFGNLCIWLDRSDPGR